MLGKTISPLLRALAVLLICIPEAGCDLATQNPPIADSTMVDLLVEFHLVGGRAEITEDSVPNATESILRAYDIDSTRYVRALAYYAEHPEQYSELYGRVIQRLTDERMDMATDGDSTMDRSEIPSELDGPSP